MATGAGAGSTSDVVDLALADAGKRRIEWVFHSMRVLQTIRKQLIRTQPFAGLRISACLQVTPESANLLITLRDGGALAVLAGADPFSTQDDVAAALVRDYGIPVFASRGAESAQHAAHIAAALDSRPQLTIDDGATLIAAIHTSRQDLLPELLGGTEQTTSGTLRVRAMERQGVLQTPVVAVSDAQTKHLFDNRYGTGQSTVDAIMRVANVLLAGLTVVVAGFGSCGRGFAQRARGMGAIVIVTEVDPIKAVEAMLEGYRVMSINEAAREGDIFCTMTGSKSVIDREHFERMKNGAILCNAGTSDLELDLETLERMSSSRKPVRDQVDEYVMRDGRKLYVLSGGRTVNVAAGEGHPAAVMDVSFSHQALALEFLVKNHASLEKRVYAVPEEIDRNVARMKLDALGIKIDRLTMEQEQYLASWSEET